MTTQLAFNLFYGLLGVASGLGLWFGFLALVRRAEDRRDAKQRTKDLSLPPLA